MRFFFFFSAVAVPEGLFAAAEAGVLLLLGVAGVTDLAGVVGSTVLDSSPVVTTGTAEWDPGMVPGETSRDCAGFAGV